MKLPAGEPHHRPDRLRHHLDELLDRRPAAEEVHRVEQRAAPGHLEGVDGAVLLDPLRGLDGLLDGDPAPDAVGHVELGEDRDPVTDRVAHRPQDAAREPGPVDQRAAVLVLAVVDLRAEERTGQVAVPQVHLDGVEPGLDRPGRGRGVRGRDALEVGLPGLARDAEGHVREAGARRERRQPVAARVRHRTGVSDLGRDRGALGVDGIGQLPRARASPRRSTGSGRARCVPPARRRSRRRWSCRPRRRRTRGGSRRGRW